jgi:hypothetical protein
VTTIYREHLMGHIGLKYIRAMGLDILNTPPQTQGESGGSKASLSK